MAGNLSESSHDATYEASAEDSEAVNFDEEPETHEEDEGDPPFPQQAAEDD